MEREGTPFYSVILHSVRGVQKSTPVTPITPSIISGSKELPKG